MREKSFRPDIEALRGIAVLLVVGYHAGVNGFRGGYIGVDVFFVLSGYLITGILTEKPIGLANFYGRRVKRLLPAAISTLIVTLAVAYFVFAPVEREALPATGLATALYSSNIYFAQTATEYLAAPPETNPLLHTWTLSAEEQFYLAFPLLLLFTASYFRNRVGVVLAVVALTSFALCVYLTGHDQPKAFFYSVTRAWEFAAGGVGILLNRRFGNANLVFGVLGLGMILFSAVTFGDVTFPGYSALIPVLGSLLVITSRNGLETTPGTTILQYLGKLSYSLYLWHWPVLVFARAVFPSFSLPYRLGSVLLSLGLAYLSFRLVEDPIRHKQMSARQAIGMGFALMLLGCAASFLLWGESDKFTVAKQVPSASEDCDIALTESKVRECTVEGSGSTVVLLGDSHAIQWYAPMEAIAKQRNWRLTTMFKSACGPVEVQVYSPPLGRPLDECDDWRRNVYERVREIKPDLIVMSGFQRVAFTVSSLQVSPQDWTAGMRRTFEQLKGFRLAYIKDTPHPPFNVLNCMARNEWRPWLSPRQCEFDGHSELTQGLDAIEREITSQYGVRYIDLNDGICPRNPCLGVVDNSIVYRDADHLTTDFGMKLLPLLDRELGPSVP